MIQIKKQKGLLLIGAVLIIVAVAFMAATASYVFVTNSRSSANQ